MNAKAEAVKQLHVCISLVINRNVRPICHCDAAESRKEKNNNTQNGLLKQIIIKQIRTMCSQMQVEDRQKMMCYG